MCIICNCPSLSAEPDEFLLAFEQARQGMKRSETAILAVADVAITDESKKRYRALHKQMVRLRREWNKLEQAREHPAIQP